MLEAGDIVSKLRLDNLPFTRSVKEAKKKIKDFASRVNTLSGSVERSDKVAKGWWRTYGRVAVGFTVAYRAMNLFETGLRELSTLIGDSIVETGELAAYQAKLAMYYKLASNTADSFGDVYAKAAGNVRALAEASIPSISALDTLTTGFDELAQAGIVVTRDLTPAFTSLISFTELVAQTTGSNIRQIRQEFQALTEGRIKTTDILARSMKRFEIINEKDIANLRAQVNTQEIIEKIALRIHEQWKEVQGILLATDVTKALGYWEKSFRGIAREAITVASRMSGVQNIFAQIFKDQADSMGAMFSLGDMSRYSVFIRDLASALNKLLTIGIKGFKGFLKGYTYVRNFIKALRDFYKESEKLQTAFQIIYKGYFLLLGIRVVGSVFRMFGKTVLWLAATPLLKLSKAFNLLYLKFLAIPAAAAAASIGIATYFQTLKQYIKDKKIGEAFKSVTDKWLTSFKEFFTVKIPEVWNGLKEYFLERMEEIGDAINEMAPDWLKKLAEFYASWKKKSQDLVEGLKKAGKELVNDAGKAVKDLTEGLIPEGLKKAGEELVNDVKENVVSAAKTVGKAVKDFVVQTGKETVDFSKMWKDNFIATITDGFDTYKGILDKIIDRLEPFKEKLQGLGEGEDLSELIEQLRALGDVTEELDKIVEPTTFFDGMKEGLEDFRSELRTSFEFGQDFAKETAATMRDTFSDVFFDASKREFKDWEDYVNAILNSILRSLSNTLAEIITSTLLSPSSYSSIGSFFGNLLGEAYGGSTGGSTNTFAMMHKGGIAGSEFQARLLPTSVFDGAARAHQGLLAGEVPIIAKRGEGIFTPEQMKALGPAGGMTNVAILAMDSQSFKDVVDRNAQTVISPLKKYLRYGERELRDLMRRSR